MLLRLFFTGELSDCTICCGEDVYKAHKAILGSQSGFFRKAFTGGFKVGKAHCGKAITSHC
jgi:hypothetical protein